MSIIDDQFTEMDIASISTKSAALKTGGLLAFAGIFFTLVYEMFDVVDYTGQTSNMMPNLLMFATSFVIMFFGLKNFRDNELRGRITLGKCISMGTLAGVISGVITAIFMYVYYTFIQADFLPGLLETMVEGFEEQGLDDDAIEMAMSFTSSMFSPIGFSMMGLISAVFWGFLMSLILGLFVKTD